MKKSGMMTILAALGLSFLSITVAFSIIPHSGIWNKTSEKPDIGLIIQEAQAAGSTKFLHINGVSGESQDSRNMDDIIIQSMTWGLARSVDVAGGDTDAKPTFAEFTVTKAIDKASSRLFLKAADGQTVPRVELFVYRGEDATPYLYMDFRDVVITGFDQGTEGESNLESVSFAYGSVKLAYRQEISDGNYAPPVSAGWDVRSDSKL